MEFNIKTVCSQCELVVPYDPIFSKFVYRFGQVWIEGDPKYMDGTCFHYDFGECPYELEIDVLSYDAV